MLYLVPTPIGNLGDMSPRAIETLKSADLILAEDTRTSKHLMNHFGIQTQMKSNHSFNEHVQLDYLIDLLEKDQTIALITDAGTPAISDPGFLLVRACHQHGIQVSALPGPNAMIPALAMSGIPCDRFYFEGFLPHKKGRSTRWTYLSSLDCTIVLYESPYRLLKLLKEITANLGENRLVAVVKEISKIYEFVFRGNAQSIIEDIEKAKALKGEFVVIIGGLKDS